MGKYVITGYLGAGSYGTVFSCTDELTGSKLALKKFNRADLPASENFRELQVTERLDHPNIVKVREVLPGYSALVMDLVEGQTLTEWLHKDPAWIRAHFYTLFAPLVDAVRLAHANRVIHRDIKPDNILITKDGRTAKLTDFGVCAILDSTEHTDGQAGSPPYMALEALEQARYNSEADVHSLGCVFYEIWAGRRPWVSSGRGPLSYLALKANEVPQPLHSVAPDEVSDLLSDLVSRMISVKPERRIRRVDLVAHLLTLADPRPADASGSLDRLAARLGGIYGYKNDDQSPLLLLSQLLVSTRALVHELVRTPEGSRSTTLEQAFPKTFAWICAVASSVSVSMSQLIWLKFDRTCPYCDSPVCGCSHDWASGKYERNVALLAKVKGRRLGTAPPSRNFEEYRAMFDRLFGEANRAQGLPATLLHMYSEVAEATDAVLHLLPDDDEMSVLALHLEVSDLIAWFFALLNVYHHRHHDYDFLENFERTFADGCYSCRCNPCQCPEPAGAHDWREILSKEDESKELKA